MALRKGKNYNIHFNPLEARIGGKLKRTIHDEVYWTPEQQAEHEKKKREASRVENAGYNFLGWVKRNDYMPNNDERVLTFSSCFKDEYRYRVMEGRFVRLCTEVDWWIYLHKLGGEKL